MDGLKNLPKSLPESTLEFSIDIQGQYSNIPHKGTFKCKIPTLRDQALIAKHRAYLNGEVAHLLDLQTLKLHQMVSYLKYTLMSDQMPKFWRDSDMGYELMDMNVIEGVYNSVLEFEESWMKAIWGEDKVEEMKKEQDKNE